MKTHPRHPLLKKISARRARAGQPAIWSTWVTLDLGEEPAVAAQGHGIGLLRPRILTPRELEILQWVARGETDQRIADQLYLSRRTVSSHVSNILAKLDVPSRRAAVIAALRIGLL